MKLLKMLSVVFLFLAALSVYALPSCDFVKLDTKVIETYNNQKETAVFTLSNYSNETFYIDRVNVYDYEHGITTKVISFDKIANPGETAIIVVELNVFDKKAGYYKAFLQARGHFQNQSTCNYFEIGEKEIPIVIKSKVEDFSKVDCSNFDVIVPEKIGIMSEKGEITVNIYNLSGNGMNILLTGDDIKLPSNFLHFPDQTEKNVKIEFTVENNRTWLFYRIEVAGCDIYTKKTEIVRLNTQSPTVSTTTSENQEQDTNASITATAFATLGNALSGLNLLAVLALIVIIILIAAVYIKDKHIREKQNLTWLKAKISSEKNATQVMTTR